MTSPSGRSFSSTCVTRAWNFPSASCDRRSTRARRKACVSCSVWAMESSEGGGTGNRDGRTGARQRDLELGDALGFLRARMHRAAMRAHELLHDVEAEPEAGVRGALLAPRMEGLEHRGEHLGRHDTVVADAKQQRL